MYRGSAAEHGITMGLLDHSTPVAVCQEAAVREFDRLSALNTDDNREKERDIVPGIVEQGLLELRHYGIPSHVQRKIEWQHPELPLPFLGYVDFQYEQDGIIIDLKAKPKLSSAADEDHMMQVALYCQATGMNTGRITYCSPKKAATHQVDDLQYHFGRLVNLAQKMENFLSRFQSAEELVSVLAPNTQHFTYNNRQMRRRAYEIFGV